MLDSYILSTHFLKCYLNPGGGGIAAPFMTEHSAVSYSQHFAGPVIYNVTCNFCVQNSCTLVGVRVQILTWKWCKCQTMFSIATDGELTTFCQRTFHRFAGCTSQEKDGLDRGMMISNHSSWELKVQRLQVYSAGLLSSWNIFLS